MVAENEKEGPQPTWVAAVMETTNDETDEQLRLTSRPSANRIKRLPSGQTTWSTCERTFSHVRSGVRKLFYAFHSKEKKKQQHQKPPPHLVDTSAEEKKSTHHVDLRVGVAHVADDGARLHLVHVLARHHVLVAGGRDEQVDVADDLAEFEDAESVHAGLQRADGVDLGDVDDGAERLQRLTAALAHLAVAAHHHLLAAEHHVRRPFQTAK